MNNIEMYSTVAEKCIRILKSKINKHMTTISKNMYIDKLDDIVNQYIYHSTIKMKPVDRRSTADIDFDKEDNEKGPKLKVGDHIRILK